MSTVKERLAPFRLQRAGVVYAFALILVVFTAAAAGTGRPFYLSALNSANILDQTAQVGILAVFMTICLISGNFDLSIGATGALAAGVTLTVLNSGAGVFVALLVGLLTGIAMGLFNGVFVQYVGVNAFIVTLGTMTGIRGLLFILTDGRSIQTTDTGLAKLLTGDWPVNLKVWAAVVGLVFVGVGVFSLRREKQGNVTDGQGYWYVVAGALLAAVSVVWFPTYWALSKQVWIFLAIVIVAWAVLRFTVVGRRLYAVGGNVEAARLSGIRVARYKVLPFVLNGLFAALVGILYASRFSAINPQALTGIELTVLAAAILGGTSLFGGAGNVLKSVIGALILFVLANGFGVLNLGANYQDLIKGVVIIGAATIYVLAEKRGGRGKLTAADLPAVTTPSAEASGGPLVNAESDAGAPAGSGPSSTSGAKGTEPTTKVHS